MCGARYAGNVSQKLYQINVWIIIVRIEFSESENTRCNKKVICVCIGVLCIFHRAQSRVSVI